MNNNSLHDDCKYEKFLRLLLIIFTFFSAFASSQGFGAVRVSEASYNGIQEATIEVPLKLLNDVVQLNKVYSLRKYFPAPGNQGEAGTCTAWSVAYLKSFQESYENKETPAKMMSPSYIFNQLSNGACNQGITINSALNLVMKEGLPLIDDFPYNQKDCQELPNQDVMVLARDNYITGYQRLPTTFNDNTVNLIKSKIISGKPVLIQIEVYENFKDYTGGIYEYTLGERIVEDGIPVDHAMVITGYDDNKQAFEVINSWGEEWGEDGYIWIGYEALKQILVYGFIVDDFDDSLVVAETESQELYQQETTQAQELGSIILNSTPPYADIFVDDVFVGTTPMRSQLEAGNHHIMFVLPNYRPFIAVIDTALGEQPILKATLTPPTPENTMRVESQPPSADLYVNGVNLGKTPIDLYFPSGDYDVKISKDGFSTIDSGLNIKEGDREATVLYVLNPIPESVVSPFYFYPIRITNQCIYDVQFALEYQDENESWQTKGFYTFSPQQSRYIPLENGSEILTSNPKILIYGETLDAGKTVTWSGKKDGTSYLRELYGKTYNMRFRELELNSRNEWSYSFDCGDLSCDYYSGVGMNQDENFRVTMLVENGPAERYGVNIGDQIVEIDGVNVGSITTNDDFISLVRGEPGTVVRLGIVRQGEPGIKQIDVVRACLPKQE
jgi:C1A family cysteine protease